MMSSDQRHPIFEAFVRGAFRPHPDYGRLVAGLEPYDRRYPDGRAKFFAAMVSAALLLFAAALLPPAGILAYLGLAFGLLSGAVWFAGQLYDGVRDKAVVYWAVAGVFVYTSLCLEMSVVELPVALDAAVTSGSQALALAIGACAGLMERRQESALTKARRELRSAKLSGSGE